MQDIENKLSEQPLMQDILLRVQELEAQYQPNVLSKTKGEQVNSLW